MKSVLFTSLAGLLALAACGSSDIGTDPNKMLFRMDDGMMTGKYNPQGFTQAKVKFYLAQECGAKRLASFGEGAPDENGVVPFNATCAGGLDHNGHYILNRQSDGTVLAEGTIAQNGNLFYTSKTY